MRASMNASGSGNPRHRRQVLSSGYAAPQALASPSRRPRPRRNLADRRPAGLRIMDFGKCPVREQKRARGPRSAESCRSGRSSSGRGRRARLSVQKHIGALLGEDRVKATIFFRGRGWRIKSAAAFSNGGEARRVAIRKRCRGWKAARSHDSDAQADPAGGRSRHPRRSNSDENRWPRSN